MNKSFLDFIDENRQYIENKQYVLEAFQEKDVNKALELIEKVLHKHIEGLVPLDGFVDTVIDSNNCISKQYIVIDKDNPKKSCAFQLNWLIDAKSVDVYSIDFFKDLDVYWNGEGKSDLSIYTLGTSVASFLPIIWDVVNSRNFNLSQEQAEKSSHKIFDKVSESEFVVSGIRYSIYEGLKKSIIKEAFSIESKNSLKLLCEELDKEYLDISKALKSEEPNSKSIKLSIEKDRNIKIKYNKETISGDEEISNSRKDPDQIFKEMGKYISLVIKGLQPSLILCGAPGVGKTFRVKKQLKENGYKEGDNLCTIKGKCTARKLYLALYDMKNKGDIVLIDDADSLVGPKADENCINILKAALDSSTDPEGRLVTYGIAGKLTDDDGNEVPKKCYVKSGVIVITNYRAGALDTALRNRSFMQDIDFSNEEVLAIIKKLMPNVENEILDARSKLKAYDYLVDLNKAGSEMELSLRTFVLCAKIFKACDGDIDFSDDDAKSMIKEQMKLQYMRGSHKY